MSSSLMSSSSAHQAPSEPHVPCHHNEREVRSSIPPADWVNHTTTSPIEGSSSAQSHFEFFYHVIFTFVHSALTLLLAPVLKNRPRRSRRSQPSARSQHHQRRERQSFREVDPELAMVPPQNTTGVAAVASYSNNNSNSILKSQRRRPSGEQAAMTAAAGGGCKSVRFPEPKRSRPPLGRISSSIGSSSSSASVGSSAASVSESSSSSSSSRGSGRGRMAPRYTPRTHHTTYFLSD